MTKLYKVTVNNFGWDRPATYFFRTKKEAEEFAEKYPASDKVKYAGRFKEENAKIYLGEEYMEEVL